MIASYQPKILVADDDPDIRRILADRLELLHYRVVTAADGAEVLEKVVQEAPDLVLLDLQMPKVSGLLALKKLREYADLPVVIITAFGTIEKAVEAMKEGAFDFITKPFVPDHLEIVIKKGLESRSLRQENRYLHEEVNTPYLQIVGESKQLLNMVETAKRVAATPSTVLLLGESGTGKEIFARSIHRWSPRAAKPFVVVNCVALRDELIESELFGYEKGAFTGAYHLKRGKLEIANGGTLFLDEIGDFKPDLQAKLLRVLQEREFERVGGTKPIQIDIRVIAATHRDLYREVREGRFRQDLFFRLNVVTLLLPPLRERKEDIPLLVDFFLRRSCQTLKKPVMKISPEAMASLTLYQWPGNIRELGNVIERGVVLSRGNEILPEDLPLYYSLSPHAQEPGEGARPYYDAVRFYQQEVIQKALEQSAGSQTKAAALLGLQRTHLARLIKKLNVKMD